MPKLIVLHPPNPAMFERRCESEHGPVVREIPGLKKCA
jgi:hypothetical protein